MRRTAFFFQAEDGIRDLYVTGVQTCALPISEVRDARVPGRLRLPPGVVGRGRPVGEPLPGDLEDEVVAVSGVEVEVPGEDAAAQVDAGRDSGPAEDDAAAPALPDRLVGAAYL